MRAEPAAAALALTLWSSVVWAADAALVRSGERLYRSGTSASGAPIEAVVAGDVPVTGRQLSCATCHGQSGLGAIEGNKVVPPIAAPFLAVPRTLRSRPRPPYDDTTLLRAIRDGIDSGGHPLDPLMPRFRLSDGDARAIVTYLKGLSAQPSPGIEGNKIHLATIVTPGAAPAAREAMLSILKAYFRLKNANAIDHRGRLISSWPDYYGDWVLHVWELSGPPSTWERQLASRYRSEPVFAVVSGIGGDTWLPVHRFCERERIPCLLPNVDTPPAAGAYSMYFSGGATTEAAVLAAKLSRASKPQRLVQLVGRGQRASLAAQTVADALHQQGRDRSVIVPLPVTPTEMATIVQREQATAVVAWGDNRETTALRDRAGLPVYLSASLTGGGGDDRHDVGVQVSPFAPDREAALRFRRVASWLAAQKISVAPAQERIADQTFFALTVLSEGLMHVKRNFFREYLLESIDHFSGFEHFSSVYPHLSFGPGQRVLSKGAFVTAGDGAAEWVVP